MFQAWRRSINFTLGRRPAVDEKKRIESRPVKGGAEPKVLSVFPESLGPREKDEEGGARKSGGGHSSGSGASTGGKRAQSNDDWWSKFELKPSARNSARSSASSRRSSKPASSRRASKPAPDEGVPPAPPLPPPPFPELQFETIDLESSSDDGAEGGARDSKRTMLGDSIEGLI